MITLNVLVCTCQLGGCSVLLGENSVASFVCPTNLFFIAGLEKRDIAKNSNLKMLHRAGSLPNSGILLLFKMRAVMQNQRLILEVSNHRGNKSHSL